MGKRTCRSHRAKKHFNDPVYKHSAPTQPSLSSTISQILSQIPRPRAFQWSDYRDESSIHSRSYLRDAFATPMRDKSVTCRASAWRSQE